MKKGRALSFITDALGSEQAESQPVARTQAPRTSNYLTEKSRKMEESGRLDKRLTLYLDPADCTIWPGNARDYRLHTAEKLNSLIQSIIAEGGNKLPVTVRRREGDGPGYELLVGTRRHWAVSWLRANGYPDIELLAHVADIDDETAFRLADIENREREDVSPLERGRNYLHALDAYYEGSQQKMAEKLRMSKGHLSLLVGLARTHDDIIAAFVNPENISLRVARKLVPLVNEAPDRARENAVAIAKEQVRRKEAGDALLVPDEVLRRLAKAGDPSDASPREYRFITNAGGKQIGRVTKDTSKEIGIQIDPREAESIDEILEALRPAILAAKAFPKRT